MKLFDKKSPQAGGVAAPPREEEGQQAEKTAGQPLGENAAEQPPQLEDEPLPQEPAKGNNALHKRFGFGKKSKAEEETDKADKKPRRFGRKKTDVLRIEDLEAMMAANSNLDPETVVSLYRAHRKRRRLGAALLRLDRTALALLGLIILVMVLFIAAFMQEKMGNFTINLNRLELYRKGVSIADDPNFTDATARLKAATVADATNMSIDDLPDDLDAAGAMGGSHNGKNYMAYTYYIRNAGKEDLDYTARIRLTSCSKGAEDALRVAVWHNGERTVFAEPSADGTPEPGCVNFINHDLVCEYNEESFQVGDVYRYTIAIWMEGDDPECVDAIIGGSVELTMDITGDYEDETSLLWKFVEDIKDTLTNDKPINAAGNESPTNPNYVGDRDVTWSTRRNQ